MAEKKSGGINTANLLTYLGVFVLTFFINCGIMYFVIKMQFEKKKQAAIAEQQNAQQAYADSMAVLDSLGLTTEVDSTEIMEMTETEPVQDTVYVAESPVSEEVVAEVDSSEIIDYNQRVKKYIKIIDKMKPASTATVMSKLDDEFVVEVLMKMKERNAAKVLSKMPSARAARLSRLMIKKVNDNS